MIERRTIRANDYEIELFNANGIRLDVNMPTHRRLEDAIGAGNVLLLTGQASKYVIRQIVSVAEKQQEATA